MMPGKECICKPKIATLMKTSTFVTYLSFCHFCRHGAGTCISCVSLHVYHYMCIGSKH